MIHMIQCLCPQRHAILAILYDDTAVSPEDAMDGLRALIEMQVDYKILRQRCEVCDKDVVEFHYEDKVTGRQDWSEAKSEAERMESEQMAVRSAIMALRKAERN